MILIYMHCIGLRRLVSEGFLYAEKPFFIEGIRFLAKKMQVKIEKEQNTATGL